MTRETGASYEDGRIRAGQDALVVSRYYFPAGAKRIPYDRIRGVHRVSVSPARGRGRVWGTANPRYWASYDPGRPRKSVALVLDVGAAVRPYLTPDDPDALEALLRARCALPPDVGAGEPGPVL